MEEDYQAPESRIPRWALIAGVAVVFLCLAVLVALFLSRTKLLNVAVSALASETPTATETSPATATFTAGPTDTEAPTVAPTDVSTATPMPMPPVAIVSLSQGEPVLQEELQDNTNNWVGINPGSEVTIQEQKLQLRSADPGKPAVAYCQGQNCGPYSDYYYYQADIVEDHLSTLALGLVFGMNNQKTGFYSVAIRPSSAEFAFYKVANGQWTPLIDWTASEAIHFFPFVNTVGVSYLDGNVQVFINGQQVASYTDKQQPYQSGRIGFSVETDGVRLVANNIQVMNLAPVTPVPLVSPLASNQAPAYASPTPVLRNTPTPTPQGACPSSVPSGVFVLNVFKVGSSKGEITIDGSPARVTQGVNTFYLTLEESHSVEIGNKTYSLYYEKCKIVNLKLNK
jgi:hypothetical protein